MLFLAAILTNRSSYMLIAAGLKTGRLNYEEMMGDLFGRWGIYAYCTFAGVLSFGAMAAYLIIVGDTIPTVVKASGSTSPAFTERSSVILLFGIFCVLPLSLLKDLSKLSYTSFASVIADLLLTLIVIFAGAKEARCVLNDKARHELCAQVMCCCINNCVVFCLFFINVE